MSLGRPRTERGGPEGRRRAGAGGAERGWCGGGGSARWLSVRPGEEGVAAAKASAALGRREGRGCAA